MQATFFFTDNWLELLTQIMIRQTINDLPVVILDNTLNLIPLYLLWDIFTAYQIKHFVLDFQKPKEFGILLVVNLVIIVIFLVTFEYIPIITNLDPPWNLEIFLKQLTILQN